MERRIEKAVRETAEEIAAIAFQLAPKRTGAMADSIKAVQQSANAAWMVVVGKDYARFPEFGTQYQAAQPFLRPAVYAVKNRLRRRLGAIEKGLADDLGTRTVVRR